MSSDYEKLFAILDERNISLNAFSKLTGIPATTLTSAAKAQRAMPWERAITCANSLSIDPSDICAEFPTIKRGKPLSESEKRVANYTLALYHAKKQTASESNHPDDILKQQIEIYRTGPLQTLLSLMQSEEEMEDLDQLLRTFVSLSEEGRKELLGHSLVVSMYHTYSGRKARLKGIPKWSVLRKKLDNKEY